MVQNILVSPSEYFPSAHIILQAIDTEEKLNVLQVEMVGARKVYVEHNVQFLDIFP